MLRPAADASPADWVVAGIGGEWAESAYSIVPVGFPTYLRVFHPAWRGNRDEGTPVTWAEIAEANGKIANPGMQIGSITGHERYERRGQPGVFDESPELGSLTPHVVGPIAVVLVRHTTTPEQCWFALWQGYGRPHAAVRGSAELRLPGREYHLLNGSIADAVEPLDTFSWGPGRQSANLWWPDDRAWCVATEIDLRSTYIGCTPEAAADVAGLPDVEALVVPPELPIHMFSDPVNPPQEVDE